MKRVLKLFFMAVVASLIMLVIVFKPYRSEVVDLDIFDEYYAENATVEDGGGLIVVDGDFYIIEREYEIEDEINQGEMKIIDGKYEIPKIEVYSVVGGDTLSEIAQNHGISLSILKINNPGITNKLKVGQKINIINANGVFYTVKKNDTINKIAQTYKLNAEDIKKYNNLDGEELKVGQKIFIYNPSLDSLKRLSYIEKPQGSTSTSAKTKQTDAKFRSPVRYTGITSPFGNRYHPVLKKYIQHTGVDLKASYVPLMAAQDGKVTFAGTMGAYGKIIKVEHANGYETRYAHLDKMYVKPGDRVKVGEVIGKTGMSGRVTGPHLHFEIRKNGVPLNPMNHIVK